MKVILLFWLQEAALYVLSTKSLEEAVGIFTEVIRASSCVFSFLVVFCVVLCLARSCFRVSVRQRDR